MLFLHQFYRLLSFSGLHFEKVDPRRQAIGIEPKFLLYWPKKDLTHSMAHDPSNM